jgi:hypothetical protein
MFGRWIALEFPLKEQSPILADKEMPQSLELSVP